MFLNNYQNQNDIRKLAAKHLNNFALNFKLKKCEPIDTRISREEKFFNVPLSRLCTHTVTTKSGKNIFIPKLMHDMCQFILANVNVEGLFRKEGSKARQNDIKRCLDIGLFPAGVNVIDMAVLLKQFLRNLPEPLIPVYYHELFIKSYLLEERPLTLPLSYLTLPVQNLFVLTYLMEFLNEVSKHAYINKMTPYNLAVVIGPNIFPIESTLDTFEMDTIFKLIVHMITNYEEIGIVPNALIEEAAAIADGRRNDFNFRCLLM